MPLPESELDRFFIRISIGYPAREDEKRILRDYVTTTSAESLQPVMTVDDVLKLQAEAAKVTVEDSVADYVLALVEASRRAPGVDIGVSPRGGLALFRSSQARAMIEGRDYVLPDDVKAMTPHVFLHRMVCRGSRDRGLNGTARRALDEILKEVPAPV